ncbi:amino acid-binding protein [Microbispora sp. RL4-1S]|uniref:Amino acid-binding protein n=1 Tax=Microbispora oryzae TaxID=2806554 RepID=A0A940WJQ0_9ACTN|nr:amino acid-binding protein [Microbispora oryzae]MBP2704118.1 amino acid-binding protein [Microbispora oryzae]
MLLRLRVSLPDRPGVLGQVARAFGVMGADILQVTVLERQSGRAVDDFTVSWSGLFEPDELRDRIAVVPGARVEAVWPTREAPGTTPDYDLLGHVAGEPDRAFVTLVDAVPDLVSADWAVAVDTTTGEAVHRSWQAPETVPAVPGLTPLRAATLSEGELHLVSVPMEGLHLVVARSQGPAFHRAELDKVTRLVGIVSVLARASVTRA